MKNLLNKFIDAWLCVDSEKPTPVENVKSDNVKPAKFEIMPLPLPIYTPPERIHLLPVSLLAKGLIKDLISNYQDWTGGYTQITNTKKNYSLYYNAYTSNVFNQPTKNPFKTSCGYLLNVREAILVQDAITKAFKLKSDDEIKDMKDASNYFKNLGKSK